MLYSNLFLKGYLRCVIFDRFLRLTYIQRVKTINREMKKPGQERIRRSCACACSIALLLLFVQPASAQTADTPPSETIPTTNTSSLGKLEHFANHASDLVVSALSMLGVRYKYGGNTPDGGLDCSGLVRYVFKEAWNKDLPRTSGEISHLGEHVDPKNLQPGDLVFYRTLKRGFSHVGIYLGDNKFIHAPSSGGEVRIDDMDESYWKKRFNGARRIEDPVQN
jgi:cell wall-associated NlpC family hydrolase